jgi:hypothetical protein
MVDQVSEFLRCAMCGDRIGVYEPLWLELTDGSLRRSSFLISAVIPGMTDRGCGTLTVSSPR